MNRLLVSKSDIGQVRKYNEDHCWCGKNEKNNYMLIVCDGLGSYKGSKMASEIVTRNFVNSFLKVEYKKIQIKKWFLDVVEKSKTEFIQKIAENEDYAKMSTTIVLSLIIDEIAYTFWMGDSRAYIVKTNGSELLTRDHNLKNYLEESGASEIIFKKYEDNLTSITNFIDATIKKEKFGYRKVHIENNDILLLSSDGLYNFVNMDLLYKYFKEEKIEEGLDNIINQALKNGSDDNISFSAYANFK
ncbi:MAG: protein phosphatase 2C domain-containing protein [Mycoplasmoidaceae bacterium]